MLIFKWDANVKTYFHIQFLPLIKTNERKFFRFKSTNFILYYVLLG